MRERGEVVVAVAVELSLTSYQTTAHGWCWCLSSNKSASDKLGLVLVPELVQHSWRKGPIVHDAGPRRQGCAGWPHVLAEGSTYPPLLARLLLAPTPQCVRLRQGQTIMTPPPQSKAEQVLPCAPSCVCRSQTRTACRHCGWKCGEFQRRRHVAPDAGTWRRRRRACAPCAAARQHASLVVLGRAACSVS